MPTYQYECIACGHQLEVWQSMMDKKLKKCPKCAKQKLSRLIGTGGGIIFKGTGFYETDFKRKVAAPDKKDNSSSSQPACQKVDCCQKVPAGPKKETG